MYFIRLIAADIPLHKIDDAKLREFLSKHMTPKIPCANTLRRCVPNLFNTMLEKLQQKAKNKKIWVSLDETTDTSKRSIANFVFGILDDENEHQNCYLLNVAVLQACNASSIAAFFMDSLRLLYPNGMLCIEYVCFFIVLNNIIRFLVCAARL